MNERATDVFVRTINLLTAISDDSIQLRAPVAIRLLSYFFFFFFFFLNLGEVCNSGAGGGGGGGTRAT